VEACEAQSIVIKGFKYWTIDVGKLAIHCGWQFLVWLSMLRWRSSPKRGLLGCRQMAPRSHGGSQGHSISSDDILPAMAIHRDVGLETLLELDGSVLEQEDFFAEVDRVIKEAGK